MALPIYGLFMQKVYADETLGYSQDLDFEVPEEYQNLCEEGDFEAISKETTIREETNKAEEDIMEGMFD